MYPILFLYDWYVKYGRCFVDRFVELLQKKLLFSEIDVNFKTPDLYDDFLLFIRGGWVDLG